MENELLKTCKELLKAQDDAQNDECYNLNIEVHESAIFKAIDKMRILVNKTKDNEKC